jgi:hypothetical protein
MPVFILPTGKRSHLNDEEDVAVFLKLRDRELIAYSFSGC